MIRNGCWSPKPRSREDFCSKDQRIHWLEIETRSASPLHSPCLHYSYLFGTHTQWIVFHHQTRFTRHSVWWLFHFTFFWFVSFITQEQIKKGWKWDSHRDRHFTTLMRPLFRLKTDLCVCLMDLNFSHHFFASARCLNGTSPPHHRQNSKVYLIFRLACFSIENNTSTLIRIGLETRNNVHGN